MKLYHILIGGILVICSISCSFVDLEPVSAVTASKFWKTETDAEAGVSAMYYSFSKAMASGYYDWGEIRGGNYEADQRFGPEQYDIVNNSISSANSAASWENIYQTINRANLGLKYIENINMSPEIKNNYLGECYGMRALCYFYAVRIWGDVPLFLEPTENYNAGEIYRSRTSKDIILNQILDDLQQAELYIRPVKTLSFKRTRITPMAIYAIMMDVYAWMHNYEMVDRVMTEKVRVLAPENSTSAYWQLLAVEPTATAEKFKEDWTSIFIEVADMDRTKVSKEQIFTIAYNQLENGVNQNINYFCMGSSKLSLSTNLVGVYERGDKRQGATIGYSSGLPKLFNKFWPSGTSFSGSNKPNSDNDLLIYRMSDLVLLHAEALAMLDRIEDALVPLNSIRIRAGLPAYTTVDFLSPDELVLAILKERRVELLGEGKYWFDLMRTGHASDMGGVLDSRFYLFPINKNQLDQNPKLQQNPGYN